MTNQDRTVRQSAPAEMLSVVVATDASGGVDTMLAACRPALDAMGPSHEVVAIVDGRHADQVAALQRLARDWPALKVIGQRPWGGEDAALATAIRRTQGDLILILPGWLQVNPDDLPLLLRGLGDDDMVSAVRSDRAGSAWESFRGGLFARILRRLFGAAPSDPFCRVRLVRRAALDDVASFGVRQHFLPVIAAQRGHSTSEVPVRPATEASDEGRYVFKPLGHLRAFFDALTLYVVLTFLRRPLRFFGAIGLPIFLLGTLATLVLMAQRLFGDTALADRPALIFAVLMVVLGIQIIAIGLVGEIIIFAGARRMKQYEVAEIITTAPRVEPVPSSIAQAGDA
ncbi:glycosyltransferase [Jannaschia rubra]|uniref:Undecaprenyl-phosphate 4-deoxy-4-formamido-L-arabinose transferase n=1 Tax=Jannaschia rubra TaxID=282197 RepID=A0A0M6XPW9_9RHOB|nr:glycosyltransferase [Jannaschia rubra]CTQ32712.1 Undecaprenyl-phosphate 4-deoxy-4-formamido-L-arabinose transferase [Jannaschia rubra]SFF88042.1 Glycosyltransferase involved in cell wall bisynthesis [Jannaschia rubra]